MRKQQAQRLGHWSAPAVNQTTMYQPLKSTAPAAVPFVMFMATSLARGEPGATTDSVGCASRPELDFELS